MGSNTFAYLVLATVSLRVSSETFVQRAAKRPATRHTFENRAGAPRVSSPERGLLELLSEVGVRQPLEEARELMESTYNFPG